jgi:hypothetical protein
VNVVGVVIVVVGKLRQDYIGEDDRQQRIPSLSLLKSLKSNYLIDESVVRAWD